MSSQVTEISSYKSAFDRDGVVIAPSIVPGAVCEKLADQLAAHDNVDWSDASTWPDEDRLNGGADVPLIREVFESYVLPNVAELFGAQVEDLAWPVTVNRIAVFPNRTQNPDRFRHIDGSDDHTTLREQLARFRVYVLLYLTDTPPGGGGTLVWPGSHCWMLRQAESYLNGNPKLGDLNRAFKEHDMGDGLATTPSAGDLVMMHPLCGHAASPNMSDHIRLALRASL